LLISILVRSREFLAIVLFLQFAMIIAAIFDIPVARQVIGFVYLTFVPGFVIIKLLKMNELSLLETVLFSAGLSIAFLMLFGLFTNSLLPIFGFMRPLSVVPLTIMFSSAVVIGAVVAFLRNANDEIFSFRISSRYLILIILLALIPILSIAGAMFENIYQNNLILLLMLALISIIFVICVLSKQPSLTKLYPFIILIFAISLLFHFSLISNYVHGPDSSSEYYVIKYTLNNQFWNSIGPYPNDLGFSRLSSMLSLTILPAIYSSILNMDPNWLYKILYPLLFSSVPLILYQAWQKYIGGKWAFMASFLLLAEPTFYTEMLSLVRQMIGEIFFALLLLVVLKKNMTKLERTICFSLFSFGLVVSHYAMAEIFLALLTLSFVCILLFSRFIKRIFTSISLDMVLLLFVIMLGWYIFTSGASVLDSFLNFSQNIYNQLGDFTNLSSRGVTVMSGLGLIAPPAIWNSISRVFAYFTEGFIVIGFVGFISKRLLKINRDVIYTLFTSIFMILLAALILVPGLAASLNMSRFYHIELFLLAPLCVLGAEVIANLFSKRRTKIFASFLLVVVLVAYFLFQTGFVYSLTDSPSYALPLNGDKFGSRLTTEFAVVTTHEVVGAQWLDHYYISQSVVYSGNAVPLIGLGEFNFTRLNYLSNSTKLEVGDFVYLGTFNTVFGIVAISNYAWYTTDIQKSVFSSSNLIYSNKDCQIYTLSGGP